MIIFHQARIKLTAWYLLIIMLISISFSIAIYRVLTSELNRMEKMHRLRVERGFSEPLRIVPPSNFDNQLPRPQLLDPLLIAETKNRLKITLIIINLTILAGSAAAGWFLAGRTLKPIAQMIREQNRFITDASHELRTPLTSLKSEIEVNLRNKKLNLKETKSLLKSNLEEVNHLQFLADGLIKLTQYQKETNGLVMSKVSLVLIINEASQKVANLAKNKNITLENIISDYPLVANKQALVELFVILLDNAVKYSPKNKKITLKTKKTDNQVLIQISDQGMGIDKKDLPRIFGRFYRADASRTKNQVEGFGLGLSIAKNIAKLHHGKIEVKSVVNKGSTFTVKLPLK